MRKDRRKHGTGAGSLIRMAAAAKLYELGKLSSGRAADLAGLPRVICLQTLERYGVPLFEVTEEELTQDLRHCSGSPSKFIE